MAEEKMNVAFKEFTQNLKTAEIKAEHVDSKVYMTKCSTSPGETQKVMLHVMWSIYKTYAQ